MGVRRTIPDAELAGSFEGCLATASRTIDRAVATVYDGKLRPLGVRSTQVTMLVAIAGAEPPVAAADLVGPLRIDQTTVSRGLARLRDLGLVEQDVGDDGRVHELRLTAEGRRVMREALPLWREAQDEIGVLLGSGLSDAVRRAASKLAE